uniref:EGF-like domain-containing protein n=1 Tax=Macrostomum lignano TaxID=282301 RepID=A0A1I8ILB9_9PLAT
TTQAAGCSTVTCYNGGTCNSYTESPPCLCPLPYIAPYCESAADYCFTLQPDKGITKLPVCLHHGNCTLAYTDPYFNCSCPSNYTASEQSQISTAVIIATACGAGLLTGGAILVGVYLIRSCRHKKPQIKETITTGTGNFY